VIPFVSKSLSRKIWLVSGNGTALLLLDSIIVMRPSFPWGDVDEKPTPTTIYNVSHVSPKSRRWVAWIKTAGVSRGVRSLREGL
jgi:hypothetical protein